MGKLTIEAKTPNQQVYIDAIKNNKIIFCDGPAGCGKTFIATLLGIAQVYNKDFEKLIISRPLVQSDLPTGYLPGNIEEKLAPYIRPVIDILEQSITKKVVDEMVAKKTIDIIPFGYMRGLTFNNSFVILDEVQNCTFEQLVLGLTRLGKRSKMVLCGDLNQSDLFQEKRGGLKYLMDTLKDINGVGAVYLNNSDIVREPIVQKILDRLDEEQSKI